jgi:hypothetical protein
MWLLLFLSLAFANDVWRAKTPTGTLVFTDSPPTAEGYTPFNVDGPPPSPGTVSLLNYPGLDNFDGLIIKAAYAHGVDPALIKAVVLAESGMNPQAVSRSGAQGLMQLMPATAAELGVFDAFDPEQCIDGGTRYLRKMLDMFSGDTRLALAGYNAGPTRVLRTKAVPAIEETQTYVTRVQDLYRHFLVAQPLDGAKP